MQCTEGEFGAECRGRLCVGATVLAMRRFLGFRFFLHGSDLGMGRIPFLRGVILGLIDSNGTGANKQTNSIHDGERKIQYTWKERHLDRNKMELARALLYLIICSVRILKLHPLGTDHLLFPLPCSLLSLVICAAQATISQLLPHHHRIEYFIRLALIAQLVERVTSNDEVAGSTPS